MVDRRTIIADDETTEWRGDVMRVLDELAMSRRLPLGAEAPLFDSLDAAEEAGRAALVAGGGG